MLGDLVLLHQRFSRGGGRYSAFFVCDDFSEFVHADIRDVASGDLSFVVRLDDHCGRRA